MGGKKVVNPGKPNCMHGFLAQCYNLKWLLYIVEDCPLDNNTQLSLRGETVSGKDKILSVSKVHKSPPGLTFLIS